LLREFCWLRKVRTGRWPTERLEINQCFDQSGQLRTVATGAKRVIVGVAIEYVVTHFRTQRDVLVQVVSQAGSDVPDEHRQLMNAALAKDIDKACELLAVHYQATTDSVLKHALLG
jgi:DNA-binding GntR family transcriptional regulator